MFPRLVVFPTLLRKIVDSNMVDLDPEARTRALERITSFDHAWYVSGSAITVSESTDSFTLET